MAVVLDRVRKLIALTSSSFEEEARTAALAACRLIRMHGLVLTGGVDARTASSPSLPAFREIHNRFPTACRCCEKEIGVGCRVIWAKYHGCVHVRCFKGTEWW